MDFSKKCVKLYKKQQMPFFPPLVKVRQIMFFLIIIGDKVYKNKPAQEERQVSKQTNNI